MDHVQEDSDDSAMAVVERRTVTSLESSTLPVRHQANYRDHNDGTDCSSGPDRLNNDSNINVSEQQQRQQRQPSSTAAYVTQQSNRFRSNASQITAMISNFSTSYNVVNISLVLPMLHILVSSTSSSDHPHKQEQQLEEYEAACASSLLAGMMVGQVLGGMLGDTVWLGRLGALR